MHRLKRFIFKREVLDRKAVFIFCALLIYMFFVDRKGYTSEIRFNATVDSSVVQLGSSVHLNLSFYGTQNVPAPDIGEIKGFQVRYLGPSTRVSIVNGTVSTSITHIYTLIPTRTGTFHIGPFSVEVQGRKLTSGPITIKVVSGNASPPPSSYAQPQKEAISPEQLKDRIFLTIQVGKKKVYVNELIPLTIRLYVSNLAVRDIQYPQFAHEGVSVGDFSQPKQYRQNLGGELYDVVEFNTYVSPLKAGKLTLGPAKIDCNIVVRRQVRHPSSFDDFFGGVFDDDIFDNFFGKYEIYPFTVKSPAITLDVLPLPEEGKPAEFTGAVGDFHMEVKVSPEEVKVGDPITLTFVVSGRGNLDMVSSPSLKRIEGLKVYDPELKQSTAENKIFEQVVIPLSEKIKSIPEVSFSFFDPEAGQYRTLRRGPFPITVKKSPRESLKVVESVPGSSRSFVEEHLGKDIVFIKDSPGKMKKTDVWVYRETWYGLSYIGIFGFFAILFVLYRHQERIKSDQRYARMVSASPKARKGIQQAQQLLRQGTKEDFFEVVVKTVRDYLSDRFHLPAGSITADSAVEVLKRKGVEEKILEKTKNIFEVCDLVRYAPSDVDRDEMEKIFRSMREVIEYIEKRKIV